MSIPQLSKTKSIHVFASDFLPFPGCPRSAGGNRSLQIIRALKSAGHQVTFSMPLNTFLANKNKGHILPQLTAEELWACENHHEQEIVLSRIQPDIAVYCNINILREATHFGKDIVRILDLYGAVQVERILMSASDCEAATHDAVVLESTCWDTVQKLRGMDYVVTVSERQKYFWSAYCTLAGFSLSDINVLVCPPAFEFPEVIRHPAPHLTVVYSGGFYPWQNPDRFLRAAAVILEEIEGATLHIFGGPLAGMPNEVEVNRMFTELQQYRCVTYHGYRSSEEVMSTLSSAWCALELMEQNLERELAITGRTLEFLASGTPVIYNSYATLSKLIERYQAGWTLSPADTSGLRSAFKELAHGGIELVEKLSANALRLAELEFSAERCMRPLLDLCAGPLRKRSGSASPKLARRNSRPATESLGRVLAITPGTRWLRELRLANPLLALESQGYIDGFNLTGTSFHELKEDRNRYDAILVQRAVPEFVFEMLHGLALAFALDCDDNILARAVYRDFGTEPALLMGLRHCSALAVPNPRLIAGLEKYSGLRLAGKAFIVPNGLPFPQTPPSRICSQPSQILWIQGDTAALSNSRDAVVHAVKDFSQRCSLPIVLIGPSVLKQPEFKHQILTGEMDFASNLELLESAPMSIGVAPLETNADEETLDFVAGKSDLKILLFAGYGHAGVYSSSPPYTDSPLQDGLSLIANSYEAWTEALEYQYREGWGKMSKIAAHIQAERHIDVVARESWRPALQACALSKPVRGTDLYEAFHETRQLDQSAGRSMGYVLANWDVANYVGYEGSSAWKHYTLWGRREERGVSHSLEAHQKLLGKVAQESDQALGRAAEKSSNLRREIGDLQEKVGGLEQQLSRLQNELSLAHGTLAKVMNSRSWTITAPLRKLVGLLKNHS